MADKHFPIAHAEAAKMKKQLKFNDWLLAAPGLGNAKEWVRLRGPGDTVHRREEDDASDTYSKGGMVKHGSSTRVSCRSK